MVDSTQRQSSSENDGRRRSKTLIVVVPVLMALLASGLMMMRADRLLRRTIISRDEFYSTRDTKPGILLINAILANMWPNLGDGILKNMRANPVLIDPYLLVLQGGQLRYPPKICLIQPLFTQLEVDAGDAPRFACEVEYQGRPNLEFCLTGADKHKHKSLAGFFKRAARKLVPDVRVEVKSVDLHARLEVMLDMNNNNVEFFFLERPRVQWDLEVSVARIPLIGEDTLDTVLTNVLASLDRDQPIRVKF